MSCSAHGGGMKVNGSTILEGERIVLVPYKREHVPRYHEWMQSAELLEQTASERLTLEQEYDMQRSWFQDENKCTFIILDKKKWLQPEMTEIDCMAGDVNLFLNDNKLDIAEIEVMIAEPSCRRNGFGREALLTMMNYGANHLGIKKYEAKIGCGNKASLSLFHKLGFVETSYSDVFNEWTLQLNVTEGIQEWLAEATNHVSVHNYPFRPRNTTSSDH
ncbi:N-acetyltransferase 9-like protein isoform X1 [Acropora millepora]|uniref:N-acetyltransferase 9-like protein isoform X1 n=1 Tax=Acropora millepora TaxID=45264 RepID=UPI001CF15190|nr:N-acetyltransferase 9-like protein isoform X1 [Acropora millepora]